MSEVVEFFSRSQIEFALLCEETGCPSYLNMRMAVLVWTLCREEFFGR